MVHVGLEGGWGIAKSKEHDSGFEESKRGGEGSLPAVFQVDKDVVVSPSDIKFGENFAVLEFVY